ncbi:MAG TPA: hypothetical protein VK771_05375 [Acidimicrobiia bacterium]|jgi:hypothetical protein|nr:hypothetical protein [Acidimicrobiia bacterium]
MAVAARHAAISVRIDLDDGSRLADANPLHESLCRELDLAPQARRLGWH